MKNFFLSFFLCFQTLAQTKLEFIGDNFYPPQKKFKETLFGGISGITQTSTAGEFFAISDDRSRYSPARMYRIKVDRKSLKISLLEVITFKKNGNAFKKLDVDFEGIARVNQNLYAASEGSYILGKRNPPALMRFNLQGEFQDQFEIPKRYIPQSEGESQGIRSNKGFEGLSSTPNGKFLFVALEQALRQDGPEPSSKETSPVRIMKLKIKKSGALEQHSEFVYEIGKLPSQASHKANMGVSEFLALYYNSLLVLERAWLPIKKRQIVEIFKAKIDGDDVKKLQSLKEKTFQKVSKEKISSLENFLSLMSSNKKLDNLEAMSFFKKDEILLLSDDNFSSSQKTQTFLFKLK